MTNRESVLEELAEMRAETEDDDSEYWQGYREAIDDLIHYVENS